MNIVIQKYKELEQSLGDYLENLTKNPPLGMGSFLKPLNQSFQICRILGNQMQAQDKRITELESEIQMMKFHCSEALAALENLEAANDE